MAVGIFSHLFKPLDLDELLAVKEAAFDFAGNLPTTQ